MGRISINDIATTLVEKNGLKAKDASRFISLMFDVVQEALERDKIVKIKGLGTFKIIGVSARESVDVNTGERVVISSHEKISFTPDAVMKELVNKPFSQFETVILNDGVDFDDIDSTADTVDEDKNNEIDEVAANRISGLVKDAKEVLETPVADVGKTTTDDMIQETLVAAEVAPVIGSYPVIDHQQETEEEELSTVVEDDKPTETEQVTDEQQQLTAEEKEDVNFSVAKEILEENNNDDQEAEEQAVTPVADLSTHIDATDAVLDEHPANESCDDCQLHEDVAPVDDNKTVDNNGRFSLKADKIWTAIMVIILLAIMYVVGYQFGKMAAERDKLAAELAALKQEKPKVRQSAPQPVKIAAPKIATPVQQKHIVAKAEPEKAKITERIDAAETFDSDKYDKMDARVRTGAYRIVGTDREIKVKEGDNLRQIATRTLGAGMECYIEVYNNIKGSTTLRAGQVIKVPKVELRKKRRKAE